jgi:4-hydroxy 2-oxovalerate aldolase
MSINLLDVSLRDGGHRTNFHFTDENLARILKPMDNSGFEYIEIGYRNGSLHPIPDIGPAGLCEKAYLDSCKALIKNAKIAVMVHPDKVGKDDLLELKDANAALIRICIAKGEVERAFETLALCKALGFETSANFIHMSYYSEAEMDTVVGRMCQYAPDIIYFADSNGSMLPQNIAAMYGKYTKQYAIPFGFHAHDNIGLAQANAIAAIEHGATYIDASLAGMGKGTGNLKAEFFTAYLHALDIPKYNLDEVLTAANYVREALGIGQEALEMDEFVRGISDFSTADLKIHKTSK